MINNFESLKVLKVAQVSDLTSAFSLASGNSFHIFVAPQTTADKDVGEVLEVSITHTKAASAATAPLTVGCWNPDVIRAISASAIDLTKYHVYVSEISNF